MKKKYIMTAAAILMGGMLPMLAQEQAEEFTVATLNVDGLPSKLLGITINSDGPGEKYTPEIANYLLQKNYDFVGLQENFNYHDYLFPSLEENYQHDECYGKITLEYLVYPLPFDGINLLWRNGIEGERTDSVAWKDDYGVFGHSNDALTRKGFRRYDLSLTDGSQVVVYNGHWDASDDYDEAKGWDDKDREARLKQWIQLRDTIMNQLDERPVIVMGDMNSYYCRDSVKHYFIDHIEATGKATVGDAWIELERGGEYPDMVEGPVTRDEGGHGWVRQGEMLDKILYINPTGGGKLTPLSYDVDSVAYMRSDAPEMALGDHFPVAVKFRYEPADDTTTGISDAAVPTHSIPQAAYGDAWYDLSGRKLNAKPTTPGVYLHRGQKTIIGS